MLSSAFLAILWLVCGLIAALSMLFMLGAVKMEVRTKTILTWVHRIFGGIFSLGYVIIALMMIPRYQGNAPFLSSSAGLHAFLAMLLFPLLLFKHYIVRIARKYYASLPYMGMTLFAVAFVLVSVTGIHYTLLWGKGPGMEVQSQSGLRKVSTPIGREILTMKCSRCHGLEYLYRNRRNEEGWRKTILRMRSHDKALYLSEDQEDHIIGHLLLGAVQKP